MSHSNFDGIIYYLKGFIRPRWLLFGISELKHQQYEHDFSGNMK